MEQTTGVTTKTTKKAAVTTPTESATQPPSSLSEKVKKKNKKEKYWTALGNGDLHKHKEVERQWGDQNEKTVYTTQHSHRITTASNWSHTIAASYTISTTSTLIITTIGKIPQKKKKNQQTPLQTPQQSPQHKITSSSTLPPLSPPRLFARSRSLKNNPNVPSLPKPDWELGWHLLKRTVKNF